LDFPKRFLKGRFSNLNVYLIFVGNGKDLSLAVRYGRLGFNYSRSSVKNYAPRKTDHQIDFWERKKQGEEIKKINEKYINFFKGIGQTYEQQNNLELAAECFGQAWLCNPECKKTTNLTHMARLLKMENDEVGATSLMATKVESKDLQVATQLYGHRQYLQVYNLSEYTYEADVFKKLVGFFEKFKEEEDLEGMVACLEALENDVSFERMWDIGQKNLDSKISEESDQLPVHKKELGKRWAELIPFCDEIGNEAMRFDCIKASCRYGNKDLLPQLVECYREGKGTQKDETLANIIAGRNEYVSSR
jgi:hypothetical protein